MAGPARIYCFDLDGTLCTNTDGAYEQAEPFPWAIDRVNALAEQGHRIIVFTARGGTTGIDWTDVTAAQLEEWGVRYDELILGKPTADVYVDDKAVHVDTWRFGHDLGPGLPPPPATTVVEIGRTYGGVPWRVAEHAERAARLAGVAGVVDAPPAAEIRKAIEDAVGDGLPLLPEADDVVFVVAVSGVPHAAYGAVGVDHGGVTITSRLLSQTIAALPAASGERDPLLVRATTSGGAAVWRLSAGAGGIVDLHGGELAAVVGGALVVADSQSRQVAGAYALGLAKAAGISVTTAAIDHDLLASADEVVLLGLPLCVVGVSEIDGRPVANGGMGSVSRTLLERWGADVGVDLAGQAAALAARVRTA